VEVEAPVGDAVGEVAQGVRCDVDTAGGEPVTLQRASSPPLRRTEAETRTRDPTAAPHGAVRPMPGVDKRTVLPHGPQPPTPGSWSSRDGARSCQVSRPRGGGGVGLVGVNLGRVHPPGSLGDQFIQYCRRQGITIRIVGDCLQHQAYSSPPANTSGSRTSGLEGYAALFPGPGHPQHSAISRRCPRQGDSRVRERKALARSRRR
jgi:hypothetical protein